MQDLPVVPPELQDMIIENLYGDSAALESCALVCRSWRRRSQYVLWRRFDLQEWTGKFDAFRGHIDRYPHLRLYVRHLRVEGKIDVSKLTSLLQKLPLLEHLNLDDLRTSLSPEVRRRSRHPGKPSPSVILEKLFIAIFSLQNLQTCRLYMWLDGLDRPPSLNSELLMSSAARALRQLRSLELGIWEPFTPPTVNPAIRQAILHAHESMPDGGAMMRDFGVVIHGDYVEVLRQIWQDHPYEDHMSNCNLLLERLGLNVENFKVTLLVTLGFDYCELQLQLSPCVNLRKIKIKAAFIDWPWESGNKTDDVDFQHFAFDAARSTLSSIPREAPLQDVILEIQDEDYLSDHFGPIGSAKHLQALAALDDELCRLPHLKRLTIRGLACAHVITWMSEHLLQITAKEGLTTSFDTHFDCE